MPDLIQFVLHLQRYDSHVYLIERDFQGLNVKPSKALFTKYNADVYKVADRYMDRINRFIREIEGSDVIM